MDGQYNRLVWCINTRTIPRCFGETKMASNNENGIGHLRALVPWLMMMMMMIFTLYFLSLSTLLDVFLAPMVPINLNGRLFKTTNILLTLSVSLFLFISLSILSCLSIHLLDYLLLSVYLAFLCISTLRYSFIHSL